VKFTLKDYQDDAVQEVLTNLRKARKRWHDDGDRHAFALSATTGAGKTVMAAAVFEALFHGSDAYDFEPDPGAVVIWFSDDPSLNEQSRHRLLEAADRLDFSDLVVVQNTFHKERLEPGKVYFLNTQKLGRNSLLTRGHEPGDDDDDRLPHVRPDGRSFTIWDTIQATIEDPALTLYLVLDEAHRGMGATKASQQAKSTIVKRLINGSGGVAPVPVVWGISATVERFKDAMAGASGRSTLPDVEVDLLKVQESGLLKDTVILDIPDEAGQFDTVLLRRGTDKLRVATAAWADYAASQGLDEEVVPLMVVQVPNTPDPDDIGQALQTIWSQWPDLPSDAVAHVLGDHTSQTFGGFTVPYISPERVQESGWVRVLIAKDAISTGWDCPRAEVMVSFRPAKDRTHITQLLGRMVRSPLARRIPGNDRLNAVDCLLPFFDTKTVQAVADALMHGEKGTGGEDAPPVRRVLVNPVEVTPNPAVPEAVWEAMSSLPSESLPQRRSKPVKRLTALAHELATDGLLPDAGKKAHAEMHKVLDGARARYGDEVAAARKRVLEVEGKTLVADLAARVKTFDDFVAEADLVVIEDAYRRAARSLSPDVVRTYAEHLAAAGGADDPEEALVEAHTDIAALGLVEEVRDYLESEAEKLADRWFSTYRVQIKGLTDERQEVYRQLKEMSAEAQEVDLAKPRSWIVPSTATTGEEQVALPTFERHLLAAPDGSFPADLNAWEQEVLAKELARAGVLGWYRNPSRSSQESLAITYEVEGRVRTVRPDFVFFTERADGSVAAAVVDPHGHHLADALPKLKGMAAYAERYGDRYQRFETVAKVHDELRVLDLTEATVRAAVASAADAASLYAQHGAPY